MKASARKIVNTALVQPSACTTATTTASMHHAVASSTAAHAMASTPRGVRVRPRSSMMRANTGKAVILMALPMNSANAVNDIASGANWR